MTRCEMKQISIDGKVVLVNMDKVCAIAENYIQFDGGHVIWGKIEDAPTVDAVEVVRCKYCKWYENDGYHTNCQIMRFCVEAEDYCSRGERREDEQQGQRKTR